MRGDKSKIVVGVFTFVDDIVNAIKEVKGASLDYRVYGPVPQHDIEHATYDGKSSVRFFTSIGALTGLAAGFTLATWTALDYPLRVSAKEVASIPGFVVVGYECTILFGGLATLLGLFHLCKIPWLFRRAGYDPRFSNDKFGLVVGCSANDAERIGETLKKAGADEVEVRDGL